MSAKLTLTTIRTYFKTNWNQTSLQYPAQNPAFDNTGLNEYVRIEFVNNGSDLAGYSTPEITHSFVQAFCYHKNEILSIDLAGDIKTFFDNKLLDNDIQVKDGQMYPTNKLENDFYVTLVQFKVVTYS